MKLKSCFLITLMVCAMFACSNDEVPGEKTITPSVPNATLELVAQTKSGTGLKATKADPVQDRTTWDYAVKKLTVAVFNAGAYNENGVGEDKLVAVFSGDFTKLQDSYQVSGMALQAGKINVLVLANLSDENIKQLQASASASTNNERMTLDDVLALSISLDNEKPENGLTMKSTLLKELELVEGNNCIGFKDEETPDGYTNIYNKEISLTRVIAAIHLNSLTVSTQYAIDCDNIIVNRIFVANVKGDASILGEKDIDAKDNSYWAGAHADELGVYKKYKAVLKSNLCQEITKEDLKEMTPIAPGSEWAGTAKTFFVYPNTTGGEGCYTLLIVEATYNYNDGRKPETRFYRVPVNHKDFGGDKDQSTTLVRSNYKYLIDLTVGVGSPIPYGDPVEAHVSATIKVVDWDVIEIDQPVD